MIDTKTLFGRSAFKKNEYLFGSPRRCDWCKREVDKEDYYCDGCGATIKPKGRTHLWGV